MWRLLQAIPRAVRQQFSSVRSAPQSVCQDEDKTEASKAAVLCIDRLHGHSHRHTDRGDSHEKEQEQHNEGGCEWTEWCQSFRQTSPHTAWEAMGWGTAVVLGIQLSHIWHWSKHGHEDRRPCLLYKVVHNMPLPSRGGLACHMKDGIVCKEQENTQNQAETNLLTLSEEFLDSSDSVIYQDTGWITKTNSSDVPTYASKVALSYHPSIPDKNRELFPKIQPPLIQSKQNNPKVHELYSQCEALFRNSQALSRVNLGDYKQAVAWWKQTTGKEESHFNLGLAYEKGRGTKRNILKAAEQYQHASLLGHSRSQYNLAMLYLEGRSGVPQDTTRAIKLIQKAARSGLPEAQTQLGVLYSEQGPEGMKQAARWFQVAARQKDKDAQYYLGICYENGWGVSCDCVKARKWYELAAKSNQIEAIYNLAVLHEKGIGGLEQSVSRALELYEKAAETGDSQAQAAVDRLIGTNFNTELKFHTVATSKDSGLSVDSLVHRLDKKIPSSSSSPTLTDYIRQNMANMEVDFDSDLESNDDSVHFTLGDMDEETSDFSIEFDPDFEGENSLHNDNLSGLAGLNFDYKYGQLSVPNMEHTFGSLQHSQSAEQLRTPSILCV